MSFLRACTLVSQSGLDLTCISLSEVTKTFRRETFSTFCIIRGVYKSPETNDEEHDTEVFRSACRGYITDLSYQLYRHVDAVQ